MNFGSGSNFLTRRSAVTTEQAIRNSQWLPQRGRLALTRIGHEFSSYPLRNNLLPALLVDAACDQQGMRPQLLVCGVVACTSAIAPGQEVLDLVKLGRADLLARHSTLKNKVEADQRYAQSAVNKTKDGINSLKDKYEGAVNKKARSLSEANQAEL